MTIPFFRRLHGRRVSNESAIRMSPLRAAFERLESRTLLSAQLVRDMNLTPVNPYAFCDVAGTLYFMSQNPFGGDSLWKSDGTATGTTLVREFHPSRRDVAGGQGGSTMRAAGNTLYFAVDDGVHGVELYKSDGTANGTVPLHTIDADTSAPEEPYDKEIISVGSSVYFVAVTFDRRWTLWTTDGSVQGTREVFNPATTAPLGAIAWAASGSQLAFTDVDSERFSREGGHIWMIGPDFAPEELPTPPGFSDGNVSRSINQMALVGNTVYYATSDSSVYFAAFTTTLWKSDGTTAGTAKVADLGASTASFGYVGNLVELNEFLYFTTYDSDKGTRLWRSDGAEPGTAVLATVSPGGTAATNWGPLQLTVLRNQLLFVVGEPGVDAEPWHSDGAGAAGTGPIGGAAAGLNILSPFRVAGGAAYFWGATANGTSELLRTDGTTAGTAVVTAFIPSADISAPADLTAVGATVDFARFDATTRDVQLWQSDGTSNGTVMVSDDIPNVSGSGIAWGGLFVRDGKVVFRGEDESDKQPIWQTDGTAAGTVPVTGAGMAEFDAATRGLEAVMNGTRYFIAGGSFGQPFGLWADSGSGSNAVLVAPLASPGGLGQFPLGMIAVGGRVYFGNNDGVHGYELWESDGTAVGTHMVKDINPGPGYGLDGFNPEYATDGSLLYFEARDDVHGLQLWRTDGTDSGTLLLMDNDPFAHKLYGASWNISGLTPIGNEVYFWSLADDKGTTDLWKTDGTPNGTVLVKSFDSPSNGPAPNGTSFGAMAVLNGVMYFSAGDSARDYGLWRSDGTTAGTYAVKNIIIEPPAVLFPRALIDLTAHNGQLFFVANDGAHGFQLWHSDGSAAGTATVSDFNAGAGTGVTSTLFDAAGTLVFAADDGVHGPELWSTDGTGAGTHPIADVAPNLFYASGDTLPVLNGRVFFPADDGAHGLELWSADLPSSPPHAPAPTFTSIPAQEVVAGNELTLTAKATSTVPVRYSLDPGAPQGARLDPLTGVFSWTPTSPGTATVSIRATNTDAAAESSVASFTITVTQATPLQLIWHAGVLTATQGVPMAGVELAQLIVVGNHLPTLSAAYIEWGDGTGRSDVTLVPIGPQDGSSGSISYWVTGDHTYAAPGSYHVGVTLYSPVNGWASAIDSVIVAPAVVPLTGSLDPSSDSGASSTDGITNINQPAYAGTTGPGASVTLNVSLAGRGAVAVGRTIADAAGHWFVISSPLADGVYAVSAVAVSAVGRAQATLNLPTLTVDTTAPTMVRASIDPRRAQATLDLGAGPAGFNPATLADPSHYALTMIGSRGGVFSPTSVTLSAPSIAGSSARVLVTFRRGRALPRGTYVLSVVPGTLRDRAGNAFPGSIAAAYPANGSASGHSHGNGGPTPRVAPHPPRFPLRHATPTHTRSLNPRVATTRPVHPHA